MADRPATKPASTAYPEAVQRLIDRFAALPGIGRRSAERLAFHVLKSEAAVAKDLARALTDVKDRVKSCRVCFNLSDGDTCAVCRSDQRDRGLVLVVEQPKDLLALELTGMYKGVYHVLMGRLSPLDGIGPGDLTVAALLERIDKPARNCGGVPIREIVLGLNPTLEGDGTGLYLAEQLKSRPHIKVTRLARGLPTGSTLEHANKAVLADAIQGRQAM